MPSTYSNLKIQLMATGENATTWGDVTNTNLGTALEEAIANTATVSFASGNVALTLSDTNGTQSARRMRLKLTGTTGGTTRTLTLPNTQKAYIVQNTCADPINVIADGGTGITVPAGKTMWLYNEGANVVDVTTHLTTLTLGTPLGTASGGLGNNTGSGASLINLNASSVSSGVLAVTYGGTNASTPAGARASILPSYTGNAGKLLALNVGGTDVEWISAGGAGTVTSVNAATTVSGFSFVGGPITASGTLTLTGTLGATSGGTGLTSPGTSGNVLTSNGSGWVSQAPTSGGGVASVSGSGSGISVSPTTGAVVVQNTGVTSLTSGGGLSLSGGTGGITITNTGVTQLLAGSGISVTANTGSITISATGGGGSGTFSFSDGTAASPSHYFTSETGTGVFRVSSGVMGFSVSGTNRLSISTSTMTTTVPIVMPNGLGSGTPALYFSGDSTTGIAYSSAGGMRFLTNGSVAFSYGTALINMALPVKLPGYTVGTLPSASLSAGQMIYVSDESGGAVPAFSDGTNWRRVTDRAIVS